jgi:hypothetical protein
MATKSPPFLMWYDDSPRLSTARKIEEAMAAYSYRFGGTQPTLVLVNAEDLTSIAGVEVRGAANVRRNTFWVGQESNEPIPVSTPPATAPPVPASPATATRRRPRA